MKTYTLTAFVETLQLIIDHAKRGRLISCSINLDPNGFGHYAYKLLDGTALPGLSEMAGEIEIDSSDAPDRDPE